MITIVLFAFLTVDCCMMYLTNVAGCLDFILKNGTNSLVSFYACFRTLSISMLVDFSVSMAYADVT